MDFDTIRPVLSGLVGGAIAVWLCKKWAHWVPEAGNVMSAKTLVENYRTAIYAANTVLIVGAIAALALYPMAGFNNNDWRPLGLGFGGGSLGSLIALAAVSLLTRRSPWNAYVAFAIYNKSPMVVLYGILWLGAAAFFGAIYSLTR